MSDLSKIAEMHYHSEQLREFKFRSMLSVFMQEYCRFIAPPTQNMKKWLVTLSVINWQMMNGKQSSNSERCVARLAAMRQLR